MVLLRSMGRNFSQLFVTIKWTYMAIRSCIIEISSLFAIFRGRHFANGLMGVRYGQMFIAKIIISHKNPARSFKVWGLPCLRQY